MHAIVVYESLWGNTEKIARAVASQLESSMTVDLFEADVAPTELDAYDLVCVGGPTHAFSMSRPSTRQSAVQKNGAPKAPARGIREWLATVSPVSPAIRAVAFDTRVDAPHLPGSAARAAKHELHSLGFDITTKPESFHVHGYEGPLVDGELDHAARWARSLAHRTPVASASGLD